MASIRGEGFAMRRASRTARFTGAILLLACLSTVAGAPAAHADYDAGKQALAAGQPGKAAAQWRAAAEAGDARSMLELGRLLVQGLGVVQNYVAAHKWFDLAASLGQAVATQERDAVAAKMTPQQLAEARKRTVAELRAAAARGLPRAMLALGRLYVRGVGVVQDYVEAHKWFNLAASRGAAEAAGERDAVAAKMTPVQVARAQERAAAWRPGAGSTAPGPSAAADPAAVEASLGLERSERRLIQSGLISLGFDPGPADGLFGRKTRVALAAWQKAKGEAATGWLTGTEAAALKAAGGEARSTAAQAGREERDRTEPGRQRQPRQAMRPGHVFRDCEDCPEMVVVPAGSFTMGSPESEEGRYKSEGPQRRVTISGAFAVGRYEVTRSEFGRFVKATGRSMGGSCWIYENGKWEARSGRGWRNPGFRQTGRDPVACVDWKDAKAYVAWLSRETGKDYRLLTEAEWEYAARAGTRTSRYWGDGETGQCAHANGADRTLKARDSKRKRKTASCSDGHAKTAPAGSFSANGFGLHDMSGNVSEWVEDCWHDSYSGAPSDGSAWTTGGNCDRRVLRGGSWNDYPGNLRSAYRPWDGTGFRSGSDGFRVARTLAP